MSTRYVTLAGLLSGTTRTETLFGREWTVVPVIALVEGVIQAMNAPAPELVLASTYQKYPGGWNGRPLFHGHPVRNDTPVSGNTPEVLEAESIGLVFNANAGDKLKMEAWIDNAREPAAPVLARVAKGEAIEVSMGAFVEVNDTKGLYNGTAYEGEWIDLVPDHLALLPAGDTGACSREMGCGVRAAKGAGVNEPRNSGLFARVMNMFRTAQPAAEMSDRDLREKLSAALRLKDPNAYYPDAVYDAYFVYCVYSGGMDKLYRRDFTLAADGTVTVGDTATEVEVIVKYEDKGAQVRAASEPHASGGCKCKEQPAVAAAETNMEKKDRVSGLINKLKLDAGDSTFLEGASEELLGRLEASVPAEVAAAPVVEAAPAVASAAPVVVEAPVVKQPTFEELLGAAPAELQEAIRGVRSAASDKRAASVKALKESGRCKFTDAELAAKSQSELDSLVSLAGLTAATDYSGRGASRAAAESTTDVPAAPDMRAALTGKK